MQQIKNPKKIPEAFKQEIKEYLGQIGDTDDHA